MAQVLLFHHALGRTPGVEALADRLRATGHEVVVPDLYDGRTFGELEAGVGYAEQVGFDEIVERGVAAAELHPAGAVYVGVSLGVLPAQRLAQTRPGAAGAVLVGSCVPADTFATGWPAGVPVQVHGMDADEIFVEEGDLDAARELVASTTNAELFLYEGSAHLFVDDSLPDHDPAATDLLVHRVLQFLDAPSSPG